MKPLVEARATWAKAMAKSDQQQQRDRADEFACANVHLSPAIAMICVDL
jgi:hypothetical protein